MDLKRLQTFVVVADLGTVSKAALRLRISQSALSRQISDLEYECGFKLFDRIGRGIQASVHLPLQNTEGACGGAVEALRCPGDPVLPVREHIQRKEFAAIVHAVPANGAVAIACDHQTAVTADVDRPDGGRCGTSPNQAAIRVESPEVPISSKHESTAVRFYRQA